MKQQICFCLLFLCAIQVTMAQDNSADSFSVPGSKWIGGSFRLSHNDFEGRFRTNYGTTVKYGKMISERSLIGFSVGYARDENFVEDHVDQIILGIFGRSIRMKGERLGLFLEYGFQYTNMVSGGDISSIIIGVSPGIQYALTDKFQIEAQFGVLGYQRASSESSSSNSYFLNLNTNSLNIGFNYLF